MTPTSLPDVLLIGTGRMAFHLGHAMSRAGVPLTGVAGRDGDRTEALARQLRSTAFDLHGQLPRACLTVIAVSDDAVTPVAALLPRGTGVVAHTSGAQDLNVLKGHTHRGVLWPIQSLSPGEPADLGHVPLVVDASDASARDALLAVARSVSGRVIELPFAQREAVHLAAVLASNFPVFLMEQAQALLRQQGLPQDMLDPLWSATAVKVAAVGATKALTGPARRGDRRTVRKHLARLKDDADLRRAYALLSRMITAAHGPATNDPEDLQGTSR